MKYFKVNQNNVIKPSHPKKPDGFATVFKLSRYVSYGDYQSHIWKSSVFIEKKNFFLGSEKYYFIGVVRNFTYLPIFKTRYLFA